MPAETTSGMLTSGFFAFYQNKSPEFYPLIIKERVLSKVFYYIYYICVTGG